jgi:TrmH family RNA methyltransferase
MGAIFHVAVEADVPIDILKRRFERLACLDMQGESISAADFKNFPCYVFGNEARGLPRPVIEALGMRRFTVRGSGAIESLNLASSVNMCAYEIRRSS